MVGVTGQVQQVASSVVQRVTGRGMVRSEPGSEQENFSSGSDQAGVQQRKQKQDAGLDTGPRTKHKHQGRVLQVWT
ncbi:unnamed protein product, partial [Staurois parvus]